MDKAYEDMMRANLKAAGMPDAQIDAMLQMQKAAMAAANVPESALTAAMANSQQDIAAGFGNLFSGEPEFAMVDAPSVNESYQWAIACGADLGYMRGDILNDLPTDADSDKEMFTEMLSDQWGIENHKDATEMCDSLLAGRHSKKYHEAAAKNIAGEDLDNIKKATALFAKDKLIRAGEIPNMLIWDLGRLANLSRFCYDAGWLSRDEVLHYLKELALLVQKNYKSWRDLSIGYQFGRAVWGGVDDDEYEEMKGNMEELL
ncbi:MAG: DUF1266 domain-containing protein, partial [Proteobacteria bacterium]|nr:DUF1266 domain-containing protein [Pseudomonadota bacterium]